MPGLRAHSLTKTYPLPAGALMVLRDASLSLDRCESAAIVGPSGSGKSNI